MKQMRSLCFLTHAWCGEEPSIAVRENWAEVMFGETWWLAGIAGFLFSFFLYFFPNNKNTNYNLYARHNSQTEMTVMEPALRYPNLLVEQVQVVLSKVQHRWDPLPPSGGGWKTSSFFPKQASHEWLWKQGRSYLCKSRCCWGYVGGVSPAASLKTSWQMASRLAVVRWPLQVSVNRRDCTKEPWLCCSLWMTVLLKLLGHADLKGLMLQFCLLKTAVLLVINWFYCN